MKRDVPLQEIAQLAFPSEDGMTVRLETRVDGHIVASGDLTAADLEQTIHGLANVRAGLADQVPPLLEDRSRLMAQADPAWRAEPYFSHNAAHLYLRHPGFGWLAFGLPPHEARNLGQVLIAMADALEAQR